MWGVPDLPRRVEVTYSVRLTRSAGRALPARGQVRLCATLRSAAPALLREVLSHELAHVVVYLRHGARPKPHGPQWRELVERAGFPARTALPVRVRQRVKRSAAYVYACPVCQARRRARRSMPGWRCAACVANGLDGVLVQERVPG